MKTKPHYHKLVKDELLFVPTGYILMERTGSSTMIYGARKSFVIADGNALKNYGICKTLQEQDGKNVEKMAQVLGALQEHVNKAQ